MSELALKRIAENKARHARGEDARVLDLGNCGLTEVPEEVGDCVWLEELNLSNKWWSYDFERNHGEEKKSQNKGEPNRISSLAGLEKLQYLKKLNFGKYAWEQNENWAINDLSPLAGLNNLQLLGCGHNRISDLSSLAGLNNLQRLDCGFNLISNLSPLSGLNNLERLYCSSNQISNLSPLSGLNNLQKLYCFYNQISDLSPLAGLSKLQKLDCSSNQISNLLPLASLNKLQQLECYNNQIPDLSVLADLNNLRLLGCGSNQISDLSPLAGLNNLQLLDCGFNRISDLSPLLQLIEKGIEVRWQDLQVHIDKNGNNWRERPVILVKENPLINPPLEIVEKGNAAILQYFEEREKKAQFKNTEIKLILLGNSTAGKTSLSQYLRERIFDDKQKTTEGINSKHQWQPQDLDLQVNLWDFGGQEYYHATHRLFLSRNAVYALVWDAETNKGGFIETPIHFEDQSTNNQFPNNQFLTLEHFPQRWWLQNIRHYTRESNPPVPILLVQNKSARDGVQRVSGEFEKPPFGLHPEWLDNHIDLEAAADPQHPQHKKWLRQFEVFEERLLEKLQSQLAHYEFAVYHRDIRDKVRALAAEGQNDMAWPEFEKMCRQIESDAKMDLVQIYLRDITGDILYYPHNQRLKERVFLRPGWVCDSIYRILSRQVQQRDGVFDVDWVRDALGGDEANALDFVELMQEFELVFPENNDEGQPTGQLVAPQYLPETCTKPAELEGAKKYANLSYAFTLWFPEFLPKSHIARFVAHWGSQAKQRLFWKNGLLFQTDGCTALVERMGEDKIRVEIQAGNPKREAAMQRIFQSFMKLEDGQAGFAIGLGSAAKSVGVTQSRHPDTKLDFVWWRDVQEALQARAQQVKTCSPETSKRIDVQPFTIFQKPIMAAKKVFISYSHKDEKWKNDLLLHCANMTRQGLMEIWQDREINPGDNWDDEIKTALAESDVVIFMISPAFMASRYIWETELPTAIFQRENGKSKVIPIFVKPVEDKDSPFSKIQGLPRDKKPLSQFSDPDDGLYQVVVELRKVLENW